MEAPPVVYLMVPLGLSYGREVVRGVREYTRANALWQLAVAEPTAENLRWIRQEKPNGIIGLFVTEAMERAAQSMRSPAVNVCGRYKTAQLPRVMPDHLAVGRLAAEHFLQRGFRHFAYASIPRHYYSHLRQQGFSEPIRSAGFSCDLVPEGAEPRSLRKLPKPVGLFACDDARARQIVAACVRSGIQVPEQVAVIGVDNDETLCELAEVPLSSIDPASRRVGFEAAAMLDRLMSGKSAASSELLIPPAELVVRSSSDVLAVPDEEVATAMRYMQSHACDPMRVDDMLDVLKVSRRTLEKRFRTMFGRTLHDEIRRLQFERARQLLCDTDLKIPEVARRCGFRDPKRFTTLFRQEFGSPPTAYRRDARGFPIVGS